MPNYIRRIRDVLQDNLCASKHINESNCPIIRRSRDANIRPQNGFLDSTGSDLVTALSSEDP